MKKKLVILALTAVVLVLVGCAGTPAAIDRQGNMQPSLQVNQPSGDNSAVVEIITRQTNGKEAYVTKIGFDDFQIERTSLSIGLPYSPMPLLGKDGFLMNPVSLPLVFPYNHDASLTILKTKNMLLKFMPMS